MTEIELGQQQRRHVFRCKQSQAEQIRRIPRVGDHARQVQLVQYDLNLELT